MIIGVGIDILEIDRLQDALDRHPRMADRIFSSDELEYANDRSRPSKHLAARFCAKEAVAKALAIEGWSFSEVEVNAGVPPTVSLKGRTRARADELGTKLMVSLTHSSDSAAAVAISYTEQ